MNGEYAITFASSSVRCFEGLYESVPDCLQGANATQFVCCVFCRLPSYQDRRSASLTLTAIWGEYDDVQSPRCMRPSRTHTGSQ